MRVPPVLGGRYHILSVLGRGGMGVVYLADDSRLERKVAVKVIDPAFASVELETQLEREARLLGALSHPGIVPVYDLGRQDEITLFYVMKHVDGETLERWLPVHPSRAERLRLFQKLCDPVSFAHAQGIAHRDLKPANVMIGAFGEVLIMDWGLARPLDRAVRRERSRHTRLSRPGSAASPELGSGRARPQSSPTSDRRRRLFAGRHPLFLLTGEHPPQSTEPLHPRRIDASLDPRLNAICARATHPAA